jgi:hypothetical protein
LEEIEESDEYQQNLLKKNGAFDLSGNLLDDLKLKEFNLLDLIMTKFSMIS